LKAVVLRMDLCEKPHTCGSFIDIVSDPSLRGNEEKVRCPFLVVAARSNSVTAFN